MYQIFSPNAIAAIEIDSVKLCSFLAIFVAWNTYIRNCARLNVHELLIFLLSFFTVYRLFMWAECIKFWDESLHESLTLLYLNLYVQKVNFSCVVSLPLTQIGTKVAQTFRTASLHLYIDGIKFSAWSDSGRQTGLQTGWTGSQFNVAISVRAPTLTTFSVVYVKKFFFR